METLRVVTKIKLIVIAILLFQSCATTKFECSDKKACLKVESNLEVISDFIFYSKGNVETVVDSARFMGKISGHKSEADIQFDGQQPPTINDYEVWTAWYSQNFNKLNFKNGEVSNNW